MLAKCWLERNEILRSLNGQHKNGSLWEEDNLKHGAEERLQQEEDKLMPNYVQNTSILSTWNSCNL